MRTRRASILPVMLMLGLAPGALARPCEADVPPPPEPPPIVIPPPPTPLGPPIVADPADSQDIPHPPWLRQPTREDIAAVWPPAVDHVYGAVVLRCRVNAGGLLENCAVLSEGPVGYGLRDAALKLIPYYRLPRRIDGARTAGRTVRVTVPFQPG